MITTSYDKLWGEFYNEQTALASEDELDPLGTATGGEAIGERQSSSLAHTILR